MLPRGAGHPYALIVSDSATNMKEGARKAPSFVIWAAIGVIVAVLFGASTLLLQTFARAADSITPAIEREYARCHEPSCRTGSLIPEIFATGEARADVEQRLATAGYEARDGYHAKSAPHSVPGCDVNYYVITRYDNAGGLSLGFGEVASTC